MSVRTHKTNVGNRLPQVCNMFATGMQQVCYDSDVMLCHAGAASLPQAAKRPYTSPSFSPPAMAMWGEVYGGDGHAGGEDDAQLAQPWPAQPQPTTPPSLLAAMQLVDADRTFAGGREFSWPNQHGRPASRSPHMLLRGRGHTVNDMLGAMFAVMKLMVSTDHHLEAAMGRNMGNTLCRNPDRLPDNVADMLETFEVPYSLHEIGLWFVCLYGQLVTTCIVNLGYVHRYAPGHEADPHRVELADLPMQEMLGTSAPAGYSLNEVPPDFAIPKDVFDTLLFCISDLGEFSEHQASNAPVPVMEDTGATGTGAARDMAGFTYYVHLAMIIGRRR